MEDTVTPKSEPVRPALPAGETGSSARPRVGRRRRRVSAVATCRPSSSSNTLAPNPNRPPDIFPPSSLTLSFSFFIFFFLEQGSNEIAQPAFAGQIPDLYSTIFKSLAPEAPSPPKLPPQLIRHELRPPHGRETRIPWPPAIHGHRASPPTSNSIVRPPFLSSKGSN